MIIKRTFTFLCSLLLLAGCTTILKKPKNENLSWPKRQSALSKIHTFTLDGVLALNMKQKAISANFHWHQDYRNYKINIFGPFGIEPVTLTKTKSHFVLKTQKQEISTAKSPKTLLEENLGWHLPLQSLYFWIRGLPDPNFSAYRMFDRYHHLKLLKQTGCQIRYLNYSAFNHVDLPSRIFIKTPALTLKLIITDWKFTKKH